MKLVADEPRDRARACARPRARSCRRRPRRARARARCSQATSRRRGPSRIAISVSVPPSTTGIAVRAVARELGLEVAGDQRGAPAELDDVDGVAGDLHQAVDLASDRPLSRTWVSPRSRGLAAARGRSRKPATSAARRLLRRLCGDVSGRRRRSRPRSPGRPRCVCELGVERLDRVAADVDRLGDLRRPRRGGRRRVLDERRGAVCVGRVGDVADLVLGVLQPVGDAAGEAGDGRAVEDRDRRRCRGCRASCRRASATCVGRRASSCVARAGRRAARDRRPATCGRPRCAAAAGRRRGRRPAGRDARRRDELDHAAPTAADDGAAAGRSARARACGRGRRRRLARRASRAAARGRDARSGRGRGAAGGRRGAARRRAPWRGRASPAVRLGGGCPASPGARASPALAGRRRRVGRRGRRRRGAAAAAAAAGLARRASRRRARRRAGARACGAAGAGRRPGGCGWATARCWAAATARVLQLGGALGRAARPLAQALDLARLGEVEQGEHGEAEHRREAGVAPRTARSCRRPRGPGSTTCRAPC